MGGVKKTSSLDSNASLNIVGVSARTKQFDTKGDTDVPFELFDCLAILISCKKHNKIATQKLSAKKGYWFPVAPVRATEGFINAGRSKLKRILAHPKAPRGYIPTTKPVDLHYLKLDIPIVKRYVVRLTIQCEIDPLPDGPCCVDIDNIRWVDIPDLYNESVGLWGPEVLRFHFWEKSKNFQNFQEVSVSQVANYTKPPNDKEDGVKEIGYTDKDILRLYGEYLQHSYPSQYLTESSLVSYLTMISWIPHAIHVGKLYRAFSYHNKVFLTFDEFIEGLAACDPLMEHTGKGGEARAAFIFRYYDKDKSGSLEENELKHLAFDCLNSANAEHEQKDVEELIRKWTKPGVPLPRSAAIALISKRSIQGIELLCRGTTTMKHCAKIAGSIGYPPIDESFEAATQMTVGRVLPDAFCNKCMTRKYVLAPNTARLHMSEYIDDHYELKVKSNENMKEDDMNNERVNFTPDSFPRVLIEWIQDYADINNLIYGVARFRGKEFKPEDPFQKHDKEQLFLVVRGVLSMAFTEIERHPRVIEMESPAMCIGNLNGSLSDLMNLEKHLWCPGTIYKGGSFYFLGNIIDPSAKESFFVLMYILAMKALDPKRVFILRGSNEHGKKLKSIQDTVSQMFKGDKVSNLIEKITKVLDKLPLCAIIDGHNVLSPSGPLEQPVGKVNHVPTPLPNPESNDIANVLMNGNPTNMKYLKFFNSQRWHRLIRSKDVVNDGIKIGDKGRLITVYSDTTGISKQIGLILLDHHYITPIHLIPGKKG